MIDVRNIKIGQICQIVNSFTLYVTDGSVPKTTIVGSGTALVHPIGYGYLIYLGTTTIEKIPNAYNASNTYRLIYSDFLSTKSPKIFRCVHYSFANNSRNSDEFNKMFGSEGLNSIYTIPALEVVDS